MLRRTPLVPIAILIALGACTPAQTQQAALISAALCKQDAALQPLLVPLNAAVFTAVAPAATPAVGGLVALDNAVLHPAIVAACAGVGGAVVGGSTAPTVAAVDGVVQTP